MLETSKDLLLIVIAFCVLWFTFFICWLLYYIISIIGSTRRIIKAIQQKVEKVDEVIDLVKSKIESSATYLGLIVEGVGKLVDYFKTKQSSSTPTSPKPRRRSNRKIVTEGK